MEICSLPEGGERNEMPSSSCSDRIQYVDTPKGSQKICTSPDREMEVGAVDTKNISEGAGTVKLSEQENVSDADGGRPPQKSILDKVLPFQRWRDIRLKGFTPQLQY
eukprot:Gb_08737 [translate_table: standard]